MVNIWDYAGEDNVRLITEDGRVVEGKVIYVIDAEEMEDAEEDMIHIENENGIWGFDQSEITSIEILRENHDIG